MFENLIYYWKVRRLRREKRHLHNFYRNLSKKARAEKKSHEELDDIGREEMMETELIDSELYHLLTQRLLQIAEDNLLPKSEFKTEGGAWEQSHVTGRWHLTMEAIAQLRSDIRKESVKDRKIGACGWLHAQVLSVHSLDWHLYSLRFGKNDLPQSN
jgi:hypothetical protein